MVVFIYMKTIKTKIGIPRSLFYYYYYPGLEEFFQDLGARVILSPETNRKIFDRGVKKSVDDICLPIKAYFGHIYELLDKVDYIFAPRFISLGKKSFACPKFMGLPDMLKAAFSDKKLPQLIDPDIDLRNGFFPLRKIAHRIGRCIKAGYFRIEWALWRAIRRQKKFEKINKLGYTTIESIEIMRDLQQTKELKNKFAEKSHDKNNLLTIAILGHSYLIYDEYLSMGLIKILKDMKINILTQDMIKNNILEENANRYHKKLFWYYNRHILGAAYYLINNKKDEIDGLIQVDAFGCGPDSIVNELIKLRCKKNNMSFLNINLDEHSGQAGIKTRLEAFTDLLVRRKNG